MTDSTALDLGISGRRALVAASSAGLGLATVMGIVKGHGGTVEIQSTMDVGTVFEVYLPAARVTAATTLAK